MFHSLFIVNNTSGDVVIEKHWRGTTSRAVCDFFWEEVSKQANKEDVPPVITTSKYYLINIHRNGLYFLATVTSEVSPLLAIEFLHRIVAIFEDYFGVVEESTIKENFSTVYQLLEEMLDNGYPMTTEPNALKAMIQPPSVMGRLAAKVTGVSGVSDMLPDGTISSMPWRKAHIKYTQNEIFLDIVEEVDAVLDRDGQVVSSEVMGFIQGNCHLSGVPDLTLSFVNPSVIDDCAFHPCVRFSRYDRDRVVSFVPPDGAFELMRYRPSSAQTKVTPPLYCTPQITYGGDGQGGGGGGGRVNVVVGFNVSSSLAMTSKKPDSELEVEEVVLTLPFPRGVRSAELSASVGSVLFDETTKVCTWTIGKLSAKDRSPILQGPLTLSGEVPEERPMLRLGWKVPMTTFSGLTVDSLVLTNERYRPYKGVRSATKSGRFQIRTS